jgi:hypothetical protein
MIDDSRMISCRNGCFTQTLSNFVFSNAGLTTSKFIQNTLEASFRYAILNQNTFQRVL